MIFEIIGWYPLKMIIMLVGDRHLSIDPSLFHPTLFEFVGTSCPLDCHDFFPVALDRTIQWKWQDLETWMSLWMREGTCSNKQNYALTIFKYAKKWESNLVFMMFLAVLNILYSTFFWLYFKWTFSKVKTENFEHLLVIFSGWNFQEQDYSDAPYIDEPCFNK